MKGLRTQIVATAATVPSRAATPTRRQRLGLAAGIVGAGVLLAACGSGSSSGGAAAGASTAASGGTSASASATASGSASGGGSAAGLVIKTATGTAGTYITDGAGHALYDFAADKGTASTCYSSCATYWPPVLATGTPTASGEAKANLLGTTKRTDGTMQVTYGGHPLYTFAGDGAVGDIKGQGVNASGGLWWLVAPAGSSITGGGKSTTSTSKAAGGARGGY
jgi:predicted lipoprotein with Yx(FWY)xxD motif